MKKLFILATAAVALASCSDSDLVGNIASSQQTEQPQAVEFGTYLGGSATRSYGDGKYTKGQITNDAYASSGTSSHALKNAQFGVFAYHTGATAFDSWTKVAPNFMYNQRIVWDNTNSFWTYDPVKYWPNGIDNGNGSTGPSSTATESGIQNVSFFAYAPYTEVTSTAYTGEKPTSPAVTDAVTTGNTTGIVAMSKNTETTDMQVKYTFGTAADANSAVESEAIDLLWGLRGTYAYTESDGGNNTKTTIGTDYNKDLTKQTVDERVKFLFKHALARIGGSTSSTTAASDKQICGLKVVLDVDDNSTTYLSGSDNQTYYLGSNFDPTKTLVTIESVKIQDQYTYTATTASTSDDAASNFATEGWFDIMTGSWTKTASVTDLNATPKVVGATYNVEATTSGTYKLNPDIAEPASVASSNVSASGKWTGLTPTGVYANTVKNVYDDQDIPGLLLIPTGSESDDNTLYVTVTYKVRTADNNLSTKFSQITQTITNKVILKGNLLASNKYYTLVMHLGLTSVKFEAVVADWSYSGNGTYNEDGSENPSGTEAATSVWLPSNVVNGVLTTSLSSNDPVPAAGGDGNKRTITYSAKQAGSDITTSGTYTLTSSNTAVATVSGDDVTFAQNNTTSRRNVTITITYDNSDYNISPAYVTITQDPAAISVTCAATTVGTAGAITVNNTTASTTITKDNYTYAVYTDADCTTAAAAGSYTNNGDGTVTFNNAGTYYIKVTSGDSTAKSSAISVAAGS